MFAPVQGFALSCGPVGDMATVGRPGEILDGQEHDHEFIPAFVWVFGEDGNRVVGESREVAVIVVHGDRPLQDRYVPE